MNTKDTLTLKILFTSLLLLFFYTNSYGQEIVTTDIIPQPQSVTLNEGKFKIDSETKILVTNGSLGQLAQILQTNLKSISSNIMPKTVINAGLKRSDIPKNHIYLQLVTNLADEAYHLEVTPRYVLCKASTEQGIFYGIQSLLQIIKTDNEDMTIQAMSIDDVPLYGWRGMMLDESRHFFGKEEVKKHLDIMARLKMNRFHWHLTDEPGWRIEIKRYPLLTQIGGKGSWSDVKAPAAYYTQDDIKEIVEYAAQRYIMVIPEIDMPGHATAASRAYPEISGGGEGKWDGFTFHPTRESTYEFIDNVLTEVVDLFPAPYIHIGGDEVHYGNQSWYIDTEIQKFIKDNNLNDEVGLEHYFVRRACEIVNSKGKKMIGWDEITNTGVTPDKAIVMWWRHDKPELLTTALKNGFDVILTPRIPCYFDFVQDDSHKIGRRWAGEFGSLHTTYNFPENMHNLLAGYNKQILGMQANVWTERISSKLRLDFMMYPRLLAIAEDAWTNTSKKNYKSFEKRTLNFLKYLDTYKIKYFNPFDTNSTPEPWEPDKEDILADG